MSGSLLPSFNVERIMLLLLRERGIIGQIINNNPPLTTSLAGAWLWSPELGSKVTALL